jgi:hypothetical protein
MYMSLEIYIWHGTVSDFHVTCFSYYNSNLKSLSAFNGNAISSCLQQGLNWEDKAAAGKISRETQKQLPLETACCVSD